MPNLPAVCKQCGAAFASAIAINSNAKHATISGVTQRCPHCGNDADVLDGTFNVAGNVIKIVRSNELTVDMLKRLGELAKQARSKNKTVETFAKEAEEIHPALGPLVRQSVGKVPFATILLILVLLAVKSCSVDISLDANKLIDQMSTQSPDSIIQEFDKLKDETGTEQ